MAALTGTIENITPTHWKNADACPDDCLCHAPTKADIGLQVGATRDNPFYRHGVYVLECRSRSLANAKAVAWDALDISSLPWWVYKGAKAARLFYVGLSKHMVPRLYSQAHAEGTSFCKVFPPTRLLDIQWFPTLSHSYRAKPRIAEKLKERFSEAFVSAPG